MEKLVVSSSPFIHSNNDVNKMFLYVSVALMLPTIFGVMFFGINALMLVLVSVVSCFVFESFFNLIGKKKFYVDNCSFLVTALILALTMPYQIPVYTVIGCAFFSIFVTKMSFGGLGRNKFNPALAGRCLAGVISVDMVSAFYDVTINGEPYISITMGGTNEISNLLLGRGVGGVGTTCILVICVCYAFLVYSSVIDFKIPLISVLAYFITGLFLTGLDWNMINLCSGSFVFVAVFMMTDPNTSPNSFLGQLVYSILFGVLSAVLWNVGALGENTIFAVALFVNALVPFMDKYFVFKPFNLGGIRNAYKN